MSALFALLPACMRPILIGMSTTLGAMGVGWGTYTIASNASRHDVAYVKFEVEKNVKCLINNGYL